jgi:hypothetical protein
MSKLDRALDEYREIDEKLKKLEFDLLNDTGPAGAAFRSWRTTVDQWKAAVTQLRACMQSDPRSAESVDGFKIQYRGRPPSVDMDKALDVARDSIGIDEWIKAGVLKVKLDRDAARSKLPEEVYDALQAAIEDVDKTVIVKGAKPGDYS